MGLPFSESSLSLTNGEIFASHKKKVDEMTRDRKEYRYLDFKLKSIKSLLSSLGIVLNVSAEEKRIVNVHHSDVANAASLILSKSTKYKSMPAMLQWNI